MHFVLAYLFTVGRSFYDSSSICHFAKMQCNECPTIRPFFLHAYVYIAIHRTIQDQILELETSDLEGLCISLNLSEKVLN